MENKKNNLWLIPAAFFAVCCILNLIGCLSEGDLERAVKPALMPTLCIASAVWLLGNANPRRRDLGLLLSAQLFGFAGDTMLMGSGFAFFAGGIGMFLVGHICYILLYGSRSLKGLKPWQWIAGIAFGLAATAALAASIGVKGALLAPMGIYGFVLMMLIFSAFTGLLRFGGLTWWLLTVGAVVFTISDALIAVRNFNELSPFMGGFVVMATYLVAQTLLAIGCCRLARENS